MRQAVQQPQPLISQRPVFLNNNSTSVPVIRLSEHSRRCEMIPGIFTRSSLRGWGLHHCHPLQQLVQQPQPLISLRSFSLSTRSTSVLVKAQAIAAAEQRTPTTKGFNQLPLGEELLAFLEEHNLHTPTEIQVRHELRFCEVLCDLVVLTSHMSAA